MMFPPKESLSGGKRVDCDVDERIRAYTTVDV